MKTNLVNKFNMNELVRINIILLENLYIKKWLIKQLTNILITNKKLFFFFKLLVQIGSDKHKWVRNEWMKHASRVIIVIF